MMCRIGMFAYSPVFFLCLLVANAGCNSERTESFIDEGFDICTGPAQEGCGCDPGQVIACYPEQPLVGDDGEPYCVEGYRECGADGAWGGCVFPEDAEHYAIIGDPELCGGCDPGCYRVHDCPTGRDLNTDNADHVRFDLDADGIVLGGNIVNTRYAYVANDPDSTVSKIDLASGAEVGRYLVGLSENGLGNHPSRTALDSRGNAYVANRANGVQGSVTKIAGDLSFCYDRNLNGIIETSTGGADVKAWNHDECVLWTVPVGPAGARPRALAVDADDRVWVGLYFTERFDVLDNEDGSLLHQVEVDGQPYGAAISRDGLLWYVDGCCGLRNIQSIDVDTLAVGTERNNGGICNGSYGIAVDMDGRVLVGGYPRTCISRYTPWTNSWETVSTTNGAVRGITVDGERNVWVASHTSGAGPHWLTSWDDDLGNRRVFTLQEIGGSTCGVPIGVGADFSGHIWTPCQNTSRVARLDPDTGTVDIYSTGSNPYTYSDFTGFLRATVTSPEGSYTRVYDSQIACGGDRTTFWSQLYWEVETPENTEVSFVARTANLIEQLGLSPEMTLAVVPGDAAPVDLEEVVHSYGQENNMRYFEIRVMLRSLDDVSTPIFRNMDNVFYCVCECDVDDECSDDCDCDEQC